MATCAGRVTAGGRRRQKLRQRPRQERLRQTRLKTHETEVVKPWSFEFRHAMAEHQARWPCSTSAAILLKHDHVCARLAASCGGALCMLSHICCSARDGNSNSRCQRQGLLRLYHNRTGRAARRHSQLVFSARGRGVAWRYGWKQLRQASAAVGQVHWYIAGHCWNTALLIGARGVGGVG